MSRSYIKKIHIALNDVELSILEDIYERHKNGYVNYVYPISRIVAQALIQMKYTGAESASFNYNFKFKFEDFYGKSSTHRYFELNQNEWLILKELCLKWKITRKACIIIALICFDAVGRMEEVLLYERCGEWLTSEEYQEKYLTKE